MRSFFGIWYMVVGDVLKDEESLANMDNIVIISI